VIYFLLPLLAAPLAVDHLQAEQGPFVYPASLYEWKLVQALLPPVDGRREVVMVTVPSRIGSEESVFIVIHRDGLTEVVARRMNPSLSHQVDKGERRLQGAARDKALFQLEPAIETAQASISKATVSLLSDLWIAALSQVEPIRPNMADEIVITADGTHYHFVNSAPGVFELDGEVTSPEPGTRMAALVEIGVSLAAYARANAAARPALEKSLAVAAAALTSRLRGVQRGQ